MRYISIFVFIFFSISTHAEITLNELVDCVCEGQTNQPFELIAEGSAGPFTFLWTGPNGYMSTEQNPTDIISPGQYILEVNNFYGCVTTFIQELEQCSGIKSIEFEILPDCGGQGGTIMASVNGGMTPYTYEWSTGATTAELMGVPAGVYSLTVIDQAGCSLNEDVVLPSVPGPGPQFTGTVNHACSDENGSIYLELDNVPSPYTIEWSDGSTTEEIELLAAGTYSVTVTDANGCFNNETFTVFEAPKYTIESIPATCAGAANGRITLLQDFSSQPGPVSISWSDGPQYNGQTNRENLNPGNYVVTVMGSISGCVYQQSIVVEAETAPVLLTGIKHHDYIRCEGETGMATVVLAEDGTSPYAIEWSTGETTATITNLNPGYYGVTVTDANGCSNSWGINMYVVNVIEVNATINEVCETADGSIGLDVSGGDAPYIFEWESGQTTSTITNLVAGEYCVIVTDANGCSTQKCFTVKESDFYVYNVDIVNDDCGGECTGSIDLGVSSSSRLDFNWSNGATTEDLTDLCTGDYTVTITVGNCIEEYTFTVESEESEDWTYDINVVRNFNYENSNTNDARVVIISTAFATGAVGDLIVSSSPDMTPIIATNAVFGNSVTLTIPYIYRFTELYYFTYRTADGCEYTGTFEMIPTCESPYGLFSFELDHIGDINEICTSGLNHDYQISMNAVGSNDPYFIRVIMVDATDPTQNDYEQIIEYPGFSPFMINDIPSGTVRFEAYSLCSDGIIMSREHNNCCIPFPCGLVDEGETNHHGASYKYRFRYLNIHTIGSRECHDSDDSNVVITGPGDFNSKYYPYTVSDVCWTGTISVTVINEAGEAFTFSVLEVTSLNDFYNQVDIIEGDNNWKPSEAGIYTLSIIYIGSGASEGIDCEDHVNFTYYGANHYATLLQVHDVTGFNGNSAGAYGINAYSQTMPCQTCEWSDEAIEIAPDGYMQYALGAVPCNGPIDGMGDSDYFIFRPNTIGEGACESGGQVLFQGLDENGLPTPKSITVGAGVSISDDDYLGQTPLWLVSTPEEVIFCEQSGWCMFNAEDLLGYPSPDGLPILASWAVEETCEGFETNPGDDSGVPGSGVDCDGENPCMEGYECIGGECLLVEGEGGCDDDNDCEEGYECDGEGNCIPVEIEQGCYGFITSYLQCDYNNPCSFTFYSTGSDIFRLQYRTYAKPDRIIVTINGVPNEIPCVATGAETFVAHFPIFEDSEISINVVSDCEEEVDAFTWTAWCGENFNGGDGTNLVDGGESYGDVRLYPNPFTDNLDLELFNEAEAFDGEVTLLDFQGRQVAQLRYNFESGYNHLAINELNTLSKGVYVVIVRKEGVVYSAKKVVKLE